MLFKTDRITLKNVPRFASPQHLLPTRSTKVGQPRFREWPRIADKIMMQWTFQLRNASALQELVHILRPSRKSTRMSRQVKRNNSHLLTTASYDAWIFTAPISKAFRSCSYHQKQELSYEATIHDPSCPRTYTITNQKKSWDSAPNKCPLYLPASANRIQINAFCPSPSKF